MISILGTGCSTATGNNVQEFMRALETGHDALMPVPTSTWNVTPKAGFEPRAFRWKDRSTSIRTLLLSKLIETFKEASKTTPAEILKSDRLGVILASTKGFTEDFVWSRDSQPAHLDPLTPLLDDVIEAFALRPQAKLCVSNACASSLAAIATAKTWLKAKRVDHVIVFACDAIDSFVLHGFHHLRVLSQDRTRPFAANRTGFHLGDAAACVILSSKNKGVDGLEIIDAQIDSEGHAATRPSQSGESLLRACRNLAGLGPAVNESVDLVIAHGTSTQANDVTEDKVLKALFEKSEGKPKITGTKWSVGHTLGTAGLLDVIAACEVLKTQKMFALRTTDGIDAAFENSYLTSPELATLKMVRPLKRVLVTSLGFGGVHAAALVARA